MIVAIMKPFTDWDGQSVKAGSITGEVVRQGYCSERKNWFWNIISEGRVVAVTLGYPRNVVQCDEVVR